MADTLSQEEIDALRNAVKSGEALDSVEEKEVQAPREQVKVIDYDFRKPHIVASDQLHALQIMHETGSKGIQAALLARLRSVVEVKLVAVDQISYGEFVLSLDNPAYLNVMEMKPEIGRFVMEIGLPVVMCMTDILLGGDGKVGATSRELTSLEVAIFEDIAEALRTELQNMWCSMFETELAITQQESNPEYIQIVSPETACLSMTFDVRIGETTGMVTLCYPFHLIQGAIQEQEKREAKGMGVEKDAERVAMLRALERVPLKVHAVVGDGSLTAKEFMQLRPGDVLCLDVRADSPLQVFFGKQAGFKAAPGAHKGKVAIKLQESLTGSRKKLAEQTDQAAAANPV